MIITFLRRDRRSKRIILDLFRIAKIFDRCADLKMQNRVAAVGRREMPPAVKSRFPAFGLHLSPASESKNYMGLLFPPATNTFTTN